MNSYLNNLLLRSLDDDLSKDEQIKLDAALEKDARLQQSLMELIETRELLGAQKFSFHPFFVSRVIQKIHETTQAGKDLFAGMYYAFLRISLPVLAICIILFLFIWFNEGSFSIDVLTGVSGLSFDELLNDMFVSN